MRIYLGLILVLLPSALLAGYNNDIGEGFFMNLYQLSFEEAKEYANKEDDSAMRVEMLQLVDLLFFEGQKSKTHYKIHTEKTNNLQLQYIRELTAGYLTFFYERGKGDAYKHFYSAYQLAKSLNSKILIKTSLLSFFKYHNSEIAQTSESYKSQLSEFESLQETDIDVIWLAIYRMIYHSKLPASLEELNSNYHVSARLLDEYAKRLAPMNPLLTHVYYEKAIRFIIDNDVDSCEHYFKKAIQQAKDYPFLKDERFNSYLKLLIIETNKQNFLRAKEYLAKAREETDQADTLRSNYYINLYSALNFYSSQKEYDSAFHLLKKAYLQEFQLDFRRNTLEINRLNVELETQEKENVNLKLRQGRTWLFTAIIGLAMLLLASYLAFLNQRKEKKFQAMKIEKLLKDQEVLGIDAMIEGQERERQRIADDLHDNLGSLLTTVKFHLQNMKGKSAAETEQDSLLKRTDSLLEEAYQKVRAMAHARNAGVNAQEGLLPAIRNFASKVSVLNKLKIDLEENGMDQRLDNSLEIMIFRMIQELITNVIKHAQATEVVIHLTKHNEMINLMVEDNGVGFEISQIRPEETMGLYSIQRKIENLGGRVVIDSILARGTSVIIDIPLS